MVKVLALTIPVRETLIRALDTPAGVGGAPCRAAPRAPQPSTGRGCLAQRRGLAALRRSLIRGIASPFWVTQCWEEIFAVRWAVWPLHALSE